MTDKLFKLLQKTSTLFLLHLLFLSTSSISLLPTNLTQNNNYKHNIKEFHDYYQLLLILPKYYVNQLIKLVYFF